jgi:DNA-binding MarR family transcriptional regulator
MSTAWPSSGDSLSVHSTESLLEMVSCTRTRCWLTYPQCLVLLALWEHDELSVKELGATLHLDYGTLTPLLKRLEANGVLRRERRADDERTVRLTLTDAGAALRERARAIPAAIGDAMGLDADEFDRTRTALRRLTANVTTHTPTTRSA